MSHPYYRGQQFCLWQELLISGHRIEVVKAINIIVGQIVKNPENTHNRLIAIAEEGCPYEKTWLIADDDYSGYLNGWSERQDGVGQGGIWTPREAINAYNDHRYRQERNREPRYINHVTSQNRPIVPSGHVVHCATHDRYEYKNIACYDCELAATDANRTAPTRFKLHAV